MKVVATKRDKPGHKTKMWTEWSIQNKREDIVADFCQAVGLPQPGPKSNLLDFFKPEEQYMHLYTYAHVVQPLAGATYA